MVLGWATSKVTVRNRDRKIFIGNWKKPIAIIKRGEIESYLTEDFLSYFGCWQIADSGYGLPHGEGWSKYPSIFVELLTIFACEWRAIRNASS